MSLFFSLVNTSFASWQAGGSASLSLEHNDNRQLRLENEEEVSGRLLSLSGDLKRESEVSVLEIKPRFRSMKYSSESNLDSNDQFLEISYQKENALSYFSLEADYARDSSLTSELGRTGRIQVNKRREKYEVEPSFIFELSPTLFGQLMFNFSHVSYRDAENTGLVDYDYGVVSAAIIKNFSERDTLSFSLFSSLVKFDQTENETKNSGLQLDYTRELSESTQLDLGLGGRYSEYERESGAHSVVSDDDSGYLFNIGFETQFEYNTFTMKLDRKIQPSGIGNLEQSDALYAGLRHRFTRFWSFNLNGRFRNTKRIEDGRDDTDYKYLTSSVSLTRVIGREWFITSSYRYARQKINRDDEYGDSNALYLTIGYNSDVGFLY